MVWVSSGSHRVPVQEGAQRDSHSGAGTVHLVIKPLHNVVQKTIRLLERCFEEYILGERMGKISSVCTCEAVYTLCVHPRGARCVQRHPASWRASDTAFTQLTAIISRGLG